MKGSIELGTDNPCKIISSQDGMAIVEFNGEKILSHTDENGKLFQFNGKDILIPRIRKEEGVAILNNKDTFYFGGNQPWTQDEQIGIIWDNDKPKKATTSDGEEFLLFINQYLKNKIVLGNNSYSYEVHFPLNNIEGNFYAYKENEDFVIGLDINTGKKSIFIKENGKNKELDFSNTSINNSFSGELDIPNKNSMFILKGIIFAYDENKQEVYEVEIGDGIIYRDAEWNRGEIGITRIFKEEEGDTINPLSIEQLQSIRIKFSPSLNDSKKPETIEINGKNIFLTSDPIEDEEEGKINQRYFINIEGEEEPLYKENKIIINGVEFYKIGDLGDIGKYTDGESIYLFNIDKDGEIIYINFEGENHPLVRKLRGARDIDYVLVTNKEKREIVHFAEEIQEEGREKQYGRIKFDEKQSKLQLISINKNHGIVCLAEDPTNTSRFKFYRINIDLTLTYVFSNNYSIHTDNEKKSVEVSVNSGGFDGGSYDFYELVRKPNSSSILEPIEKDGKEYFIVRIPNSDNRYVQLNNNKTGFSFVQGEFEIDPKTSLPVQSKSFVFDGEKSFVTKKGEIELGGEMYKLCKENGTLTNDPKEAILEIGGNKALVIKKEVHGGSKIMFLYFGKNDDQPQIINSSFFISNLNSSISDKLETKIKRITLDGKEYVSRKFIEDVNALLILDVENKWIKERYINDKGTNNGDYEGEEFECNGEAINICEIISDIYVKDFDGNVFFRTALTNKLEKVDLPESISFGNSSYCEPSNYPHHVSLKLINSGFLTIKIDGKKLYLTEFEESEYPIDGNRVTVSTFFNSETNKLESYKKVGTDYEKVNLGGTDDLAFGDSDQIYIDSLKHKNHWEYIIVPKNGLFNANVINNDANCVLLGYKKGKLFDTGLNSEAGEFGTYAVKKIGNTIYAILTEEKGHKIELKEEGKILVNGIEYDEKMLKFLHEDLTKEIKDKNMQKVIQTVGSAVTGALNKLKK